MKYDRFEVLEKELVVPEEHKKSNVGDSCADTCRALVLGAKKGAWANFITHKGYIRHPSLSEEGPKWDERDFSNDQFLPLLMVMLLDPFYSQIFDITQKNNILKIHGTETFLSVGCWALLRKQFWLLNVANIIQGWIFRFSYRWSDSEEAKKKIWRFEKSENESADYLNFIVIYVFLKRMGKWATLNRPKEECLQKVREYFILNEKPEPNSEWVVELFERALK